MKMLTALLLALVLCVGAAMAQEGYDALSGAWRTGEEAEGEEVLLLYPGSAFRLHQYNAEDNETLLLEGTRAVDGNTIVVSDIRLGALDAEGNYVPIENMERDIRYNFTLETEGDVPALTLTDEHGMTMVFYAFDMDSPE